ncbi:uncharacterized protein LOC114359096 [Ostrinia furnacalis]|uniref:uncharacterized protein LOC114359096 n=1 Tax=Ostrinia furnacalis TaxID=93504 RepID=UPI00103AC06A|nr:uncharacterized protein LOC114359096 [Ostrinia furnacalis]
MVSKVLVTLCVVMAVGSSTAAGWGWGAPDAAVANPWAAGVGSNPWIPPWVAAAPWYPQWTPCTTIGSSCVDCTTKLVCTKIGGIQRACNDPTLPYCNLGECSATPSAGCEPATDAPQV